MRQPADKVKEGLLHADQDVRDAAAYYFADSFSSDPTIMPLVIQAIEKYGFDNAFSTYSFLKNLVQTDETVSWLIRQLTTLGQPTNEKEAEPVLAYFPALVHADPAVLKRHESEIMAMETWTPNPKMPSGNESGFRPVQAKNSGEILKSSARRMKTKSRSPTRILISVAALLKPWAVFGMNMRSRFWRSSAATRMNSAHGKKALPSGWPGK